MLENNLYSCVEVDELGYWKLKKEYHKSMQKFYEDEYYQKDASFYRNKYPDVEIKYRNNLFNEKESIYKKWGADCPKT